MEFTESVVSAVLSHMNDDHLEDSLVIVRAFGQPEARSAAMTGLDSEAGVWSASVDGKDVSVRVPWPAPLEDRPGIRKAVVALYRDACARLGITPHGEH